MSESSVYSRSNGIYYNIISEFKLVLDPSSGDTVIMTLLSSDFNDLAC